MVFNLVKLKLLFVLIINQGITRAATTKTGNGSIARHLIFPGQIGTDPNKTAHISPRYEGIVKQVFFKTGDITTKGAKLATVEQNNVVSQYNILAPISGTILHRSINPGELIREDQKVFKISDLKIVWANFEVKPQFIGNFREGEGITILSQDNENKEKTSAKIFFIAPTINDTTRTIRVSVALDNKSGRWIPGKLVDGHIFEKEIVVPHTAPTPDLKQEERKAYVQGLNNSSIEQVPIQIGLRDQRTAEALPGIENGSEIVQQHSDSKNHQELQMHDMALHEEHKH